MMTTNWIAHLTRENTTEPHQTPDVVSTGGLEVAGSHPASLTTTSLRDRRSDPGSMQNNVRAAREISEARTADYSSMLWAEVTVMDGPHGAYVMFPDIVGAALVGRGAAFSAIRGDLGRYQPPEFDIVAVAVLTAWFLDYGFFRFALERLPV